MTSRNRFTWSSVRSRTRVSALTLVCTRIVWGVGSPRPKMYVSAISTRCSRGMSTPAIRAISPLSLTLLVLGVRAQAHHHPVATDDLAVFASSLDRGLDFQRFLVFAAVLVGRVTSGGT